MSDPLRPIRAGDGPLPAAALNLAVAGGLAARRARGTRSNGQVAELSRPATELLVKWTGTEALPEFSVVTYAGGTVISQVTKPLAVSESPVYEGGTPADSGDAFAILLEPARANGFARAVSMGHAVVDIDVTDEAHTHANATPGETLYLTSGTSGRAEIIAKPAGTGVLRCTVLIGGGGGEGGCAGSVCLDYWSATSANSSETWSLANGQSAVVWQTLTAPPIGQHVVVHAGITGGPLVFGAASPSPMVMFARLVIVETDGSITGLTRHSQLAVFRRQVTAPLFEHQDFFYDPWYSGNGGGATVIGAVRQGIVAVRHSFTAGQRIAWEVLAVGSGGYRVLIGQGSTFVMTMTGCGECSPTMYTPPIPTPPSPPPPPSSIAVSFQARPTTGFAPLAVSFTDTTTGDPISWVWNFGGDKSSYEQNPSWVFGVPGTYTVTLTATNAAGDSGTASVQIIVYDKETVPDDIRKPLKAALRVSKATGGAPLEVGFGNESTGGTLPIAYRLVYGDGDADTATDSLTPHTYTDPGGYTATLIATDATGVVSVVTASITVEAPADTGDNSLTASFTWFQVGPTKTVVFTDASGTTGAAIASWAWDFGDGNTSTTQSPAHGFAAYGMYHVVLTIDNGDDVDTYETDITIS